ncbi:MAG: response regulator transcription factor [Candidatus Omnitrophica bacterium]|nr:response regulator transcription factor [Candidatus Omnitrophota bacterium]
MITLNPPHILVVEDDKDISRLITYQLDREGFDWTAAKSGEKGLKIMEKRRVDLVLLDIILPKMNGWEVCRQIRENERFKSVPVIMVTAKSQETDRVQGFELGATDYIVKPFSVRELILRIKARLRVQKSAEQQFDNLKAGDITVDLSRHRVTVGDKDVVLTNMEFKLLVIFLRRQGRVQSRDTLLQHVWNIENDVMTRTVDTHIKRLREKLEGHGKFIETIRGVGYRFKEASDA